MENTKNPLLSKTNWLALLMALVAFIPSVSAWISANPTMFANIVAGIFVVLRFVSKDKLAFWE